MTDIDLSPGDYEACDFKEYLEQLRERIVNRTGIPLAFFNDALALLRVVDKLDKEADWLAREVSSWEHDQLDGTGKHIREVPELREAARKAVEGI